MCAFFFDEFLLQMVFCAFTHSQMHKHFELHHKNDFFVGPFYLLDIFR